MPNTSLVASVVCLVVGFAMLVNAFEWSMTLRMAPFILVVFSATLFCFAGVCTTAFYIEGNVSAHDHDIRNVTEFPSRIEWARKSWWRRDERKSNFVFPGQKLTLAHTFVHRVDFLDVKGEVVDAASVKGANSVIRCMGNRACSRCCAFRNEFDCVRS